MTATTRWVQMRRKLYLHNTSTTEHLQICSCDIKQQSWRTTVKHENKRIPRHKADKHKCSTIAEKKPNSRQKLWLIESIQTPSHLLFLHEKNSNTLPERCCIQVMWVRFNGCVIRLRENLVCTKHTDLVTFDANRQHRPKTQKSLVRQHYAHHVLSIKMNASSPNWKLAYHGHFFLSLTPSLPMGLECSMWCYVFLLHLMKYSSIGHCCTLGCIPKVLKPSPML